MYRDLNLPLPFARPDLEPTPLVINGASGAVGAFALKLAVQTPAIHPIIAIAGANSQTSKDLGAHVVLDYRSPTIAEDLAKALKGVENADKTKVFDTTNNDASIKYL